MDVVGDTGDGEQHTLSVVASKNQTKLVFIFRSPPDAKGVSEGGGGGGGNGYRRQRRSPNFFLKKWTTTRASKLRSGRPLIGTGGNPPERPPRSLASTRALSTKQYLPNSELMLGHVH